MKEGVGLCRACGTLTRLSELAEDPEFATADASKPPHGCNVSDVGDETIVTASTRTVGGALGALFGCLFWNGIVSVFVAVALGGTLRYLFGSIPAWFPMPEKSSNGLADSPGGILFLWLFLTPFITIGLLVFGTTLLCFMGRIEVRLRGADGLVRSGFGPFWWTRRFDTQSVRNVCLGQSRWRQNGRSESLVQIQTEKRTIRFGTQLPDERRVWMAVVCRDLLIDLHPN
jgi:hypothetical protein